MFDIALVLLAEDAGVEPIKLNRGGLDVLVEAGDPMRTVGFGGDENDDFGIKRTIVTPVDSVSPQYQHTGFPSGEGAFRSNIDGCVYVD